MWFAISQRGDINKHGMLIDDIEVNYTNYFEQFGINLVMIPNTSKEIELYFNKLPIKGIILSGGNDVDPELYGEKIKKGLSVSIERDKTEQELLTIAINKKLPVLGICKGMQMINVFFKGKLLMNIKKQLDVAIEHVNINHPIKIVDDKAKKILGSSINVNSYHGQGITVDTLASDLEPFAIAFDGIIEGFYHKKLPIAGIQWHPERKSPDEKANAKIIKMFIEQRLYWKL